VYIPKCFVGFTQLKLIGYGAFSLVFSAYHLLDKNTYALKCIPLPDNREIIREKSREIIILSRLNHPNIIRYFNSWIECIPNTLPKFITNHISKIEEIDNKLDIFFFIQMEKVDTTLDKWIEMGTERHHYSSIISQIINGLTYLHGQNIIHCDLKPDNIALIYENNKWVVKIMDFGLASFKGVKTINYQYYGSHLYVAPEMNQLDYLPDFSTDIYSLGVIIYQLIFPFKTESEKIIKIEQWKKGIKSSQYPILNNMINIDKNKRPLLEDIQKINISHLS
jgi:serine/threonine protein kinase